MITRKIRNATFVGLCLLPIACGLTKQEVKDVTNKALSWEQTACILATQISDDATLAEICHISNDLMPLVHDLVGKRASINQKAAAAWRGNDGGITEAGK